MNPDLSSRKRTMRLKDRDALVFTPALPAKPGVIFQSSYPKDGPCIKCGATFRKNTPKQMCPECKTKRAKK